MANFNSSFSKMITNEGGYILHEVKGDSGGMTYAGIARNYHTSWSGWRLLDGGERGNSVKDLVPNFYKEKFWNKIKGDEIVNDEIASALFDFSVNAGTGTATRLAQRVVGVVVDGVFGKKTLAEINKQEVGEFIAAYSLAKIARYAQICNRKRSQSKFLLGWINRTLRGLS